MCERGISSRRNHTHLEEIEDCLLSLILCVEEYEGWKRAPSELLIVFEDVQASTGCSRHGTPDVGSGAHICQAPEEFLRPELFSIAFHPCISSISAFFCRMLSLIGTSFLRLFPICFYHATIRSVRPSEWQLLGARYHHPSS